MSRAPLTALLLGVLAGGASAQSTLFTVNGDPTEGFGSAFASLPDLDGDGFDELVVGFPTAASGGSERGRVDVLDGRTRTPIFSPVGDADFNQLGHVVASVGDVDDDGVADFGAGTVSGNYARVWSGADGSVLHTFTTIQPGDLLGSSIDGVGDLDGDGHDDVVVGTNRLLVFAPGFARVFSGDDGSELFTLSGDSVFDGFGTAVAGGGDANGDGTPDIVVGGERLDGNGTDSGGLRVFSGVDGSELFTVFGDVDDDFLGKSVDFVDDVNGDGRDEIIAGAPGCGILAICGGLSGFARLYSGDGGAELMTIHGASAFSQLGESVCGVDDVDGDGAGDFAVAARLGDTPAGDDSGYATVYSGASGTVLFERTGEQADDELGLVAGGGDHNRDGVPDVLFANAIGELRALSIALGRSTNEISLSAGGVQQLSGVAGPEFAFSPAVILGTLNGTEPGLPIGNVVLPLNLGSLNPISGGQLTQAVFIALAGDPGALKGVVAPSASALPIVVRAGNLGALGQARLTLRIVPGSFPALAGGTVHHAFLVFDGTTQKAVFASNAAALTLLP